MSVSGGHIFKLGDPVLERNSRRLIMKLVETEVDVTNIRESRMLELLAPGVTKWENCLQGVKVFMASMVKRPAAAAGPALSATPAAHAAPPAPTAPALK